MFRGGITVRCPGVTAPLEIRRVILRPECRLYLGIWVKAVILSPLSRSMSVNYCMRRSACMIFVFAWLLLSSRYTWPSSYTSLLLLLLLLTLLLTLLLFLSLRLIVLTMSPSSRF